MTRLINPMPKVIETLAAYRGGDIDAATVGIQCYVGIMKTALTRNQLQEITVGERLKQLEELGYTVVWNLTEKFEWNIQLNMPKGDKHLPISLGSAAPFHFRKRVDAEQERDSSEWLEPLETKYEINELFKRVNT